MTCLPRMLCGMARQSKMRPAFYRLHALTLTRTTSVEDLADALRAADAVPDRHRLSEGAVYTAACRRYLLDTGTDWKAQQVTETTTTWGQSAHRGRYTDTGWRCSCGEAGATPEPEAAHEAHRAAAGVTLSV